MLSIGSVENGKPSSGPMYFTADLNDESEFPDPRSLLQSTTGVEEGSNSVSVKKKLSKERRTKVKESPSGKGMDVPIEVPPPPEASGLSTRPKRAVTSRKTRFNVSECAQSCCRPEGPSGGHQRNYQEIEVEPSGSNLELPPVADDDRQASVADYDQDSEAPRRVETSDIKHSNESDVGEREARD